MSQTTRTMTVDDLWGMPHGGKPYELVNGELRLMSPTGGEHGATTIYLTVPLGYHVDCNDQGVVVAAETGFILTRNPDTVRAADIGFIRKDRIPIGGLPKQFIPFAPDLAVEVMSPWDTMPALEEKVGDWLAAGTPLVWLVIPKRRIVKVFRSLTDVTVLTDQATLDGGDVVPGFSLPIVRIFR